MFFVCFLFVCLFCFCFCFCFFQGKGHGPFFPCFFFLSVVYTFFIFLSFLIHKTMTDTHSDCVSDMNLAYNNTVHAKYFTKSLNAYASNHCNICANAIMSVTRVSQSQISVLYINEVKKNNS